MRATAAERERELEVAISLREKEIQELEERKAALKSQLVVATPALREDPLLASFPILDYCGKRAKKSLLTVPLEQVGNVLSQFDIAARAIALKNKEDGVQLSALRRQLGEQEKRHNQYSEKKQRIADEAGIDIKFITPKSHGGDFALQDYCSEATIEELDTRKKVVLKETHAAKTIAAKKCNAIAELSQLVQDRKGLIDQIDELYNEIRVVDRDIAIEEEAIAHLTEDNKDADLWLADKNAPPEATSRALIEQDVIDLKLQKEETINEQRIPQERVVKAQDYRLAQLTKRLECVDRALKHNRLSRDVNRIVSSNWSEHTIEVPESREELYEIELIIPAQEKIHPGIYNLLLTEKEKTARNVSVLNISAKEKEEVIAALSCKLEALSRECNLAIQQLDELASGSAFAEESQRTEALQWVREQRSYYNDLYVERQKLRCIARRK
ncbi:hypothetical protein STCU_05777 [Strigomonas culicis]|uniref:Uncharacterized protein n=1 Tax=Strigomonas culicis TaxID=28005 RepID=S9VJX2_9TRYP|nr:hypothetical protein STCU_05777 [Strigomonas culicis]|eukprot:EPY27386.1 hypothetical protein STCU_05777 [Strigomonas culicis]